MNNTIAALEINNLTKVYSNGFSALKGINLRVEQGDFFALLGENGAGKSTIIGIISSLINKSSGSVSLFGIDMDKDLESAKSKIGIVPQDFNFGIFESVYQILINQAGYYGIPRSIAKQKADHYLQILGLYDKKDSQAGKLSGGMKRRLMIARALLHQPKLIILDEPTVGVDIEMRRSMWDFLMSLNQSGTTIILTTHYLEEAETLCRNIAIIDNGIIIENKSKKDLLDRIDSESFLLDLNNPIVRLSNQDGLTFEILDSTTLQATISKNKSVNDLFSYLESQKIKVVSLKNKSNRLEELFLNLVKKN